MESQHYPSVAGGVIHNRTPGLDARLWEATVRRIMGVLQIIFGVIELSLGIVVVVPIYSNSYDFVGWGIWNGVLAILAGCLGVSKLRIMKGVARAYMGTSIITAILCVDCFIYAAIGVSSKKEVLYIILCITFFIQTAISSIGASVTCGVLCSTTDQTQMNPPSYPQVVLESQQHPSLSQSLLDNTTRSDDRFVGANVRRIVGIVQIAIGGIGVMLGIAVIIVPDFSFFVNQDYVGWGIWHGLFAILSGTLGVFHARKTCLVIAYAITSIVTVVLCAGCVFYAFFKAFWTRLDDNRDVNLPIYIILSFVFVIQMLISVIGATFSCDSMTIQSQQVINPSSNPEATLETQQTSCVTPGALNNPTRLDGIFWGANIRRAMGVLQIMFGGIGCALGIIFIFLSDCFFFHRNDYIGWGVSSGVFAMVSGLFGVFSVKKKCVVRTYMISSIINAVLCVDGLAYVLMRALPYRWSDSCNSLFLAMHISFCIVLFIQVMVSTIGASFSCFAVDFRTNQLQQALSILLCRYLSNMIQVHRTLEMHPKVVLQYRINPSADCNSEVRTIQPSV